VNGSRESETRGDSEPPRQDLISPDNKERFLTKIQGETWWRMRGTTWTMDEEATNIYSALSLCVSSILLSRSSGARRVPRYNSEADTERSVRGRSRVNNRLGIIGM
jgi:hypothetical protein